MSDSGDDDYQDSSMMVAQLSEAGRDSHGILKKRKVQRACDSCRRKKIRCDGPILASPGARCSNCVANNLECTYVEVAKKRGPPKGYVESLENRLEKMEILLQRLFPGTDFSPELGPPIERNIWAKDPSAFPARAKATVPPVSKDPPRGLLVSPVRPLGPGGVKSESDDEQSNSGPFGNFTIAEDLSRLSLTNVARRFYGRSSILMYVQAAVDRKREFLQSQGAPDRAGSPVDNTLPTFRPEVWAPSPWELTTPRSRAVHEFEFPPTDLTEKLIDIYFRSNNCHFPLLHRPTFEKHYYNGLHKSSKPFAEILLLVCATASRCTDDPRVLLDSNYPHSAGWKYYEQVNIMDRSLIMPLTLFDLQGFTLAAWYLLESSANHAAWSIAGVAIRMAQDVGAHRRKVYGTPMTPDDELWKRAFWCLIAIDRLASSALGRVPAIYDSDIDVDLPHEVDDEYWTHPDPNLAFQQPPDKPSYVTAFIHLLRLCSIVAATLQTIYAVNKAQVRGISGPLWEQQALAELDGMINKWISQIPKHLEWSAQKNNGEHPVFFTQAASLYTNLYHTQILIHYPFISINKKPAVAPIFASQSVCVNAARSCALVVDAYRRRSHYFAPWCAVGAITAAIIMLQAIWGATGPGTQVDVPETMKEIDMCMQVIVLVERRWPSIGRVRDALAFLMSSEGLPFPASSPSPTANQNGKRERDDELLNLGVSASVFQPQGLSTVTPKGNVAISPTSHVPSNNSTSTGGAAGPSGSGRRLPSKTRAKPKVGNGGQIQQHIPPVDYALPHSPATGWYPGGRMQESPQTEHGNALTPGPPPLSAHLQNPNYVGNPFTTYHPSAAGSGSTGSSGSGNGLGPSTVPYHHPQESFIRRDGGSQGVMGGMPPGMPIMVDHSWAALHGNGAAGSGGGAGPSHDPSYGGWEWYGTRRGGHLDGEPPVS